MGPWEIAICGSTYQPLRDGARVFIVILIESRASVHLRRDRSSFVMIAAAVLFGRTGCKNSKRQLREGRVASALKLGQKR